MKSKKSNKNVEKCTKEKNKHHKHKHKRKKVRSSTSSTSDSEPGELEWVEAPSSLANFGTNDEARVSHEAWMESDEFVRTVSRSEMTSVKSRREEKLQEKHQREQEEEEMYRQRELNPNMRSQKVQMDNAPSPQLPSTSVGDGGYSYLCKAHLRIKEQAQSQGKSMEEVAQERWGSLEKLESMISDAKARMEENSRNKYRSSFAQYKKTSSRSRDFKRPTPKTPNSANEFRYERPKDHQRNRSKLNYSSSRDSRRERQHQEPSYRSSDEDDFSKKSLGKHNDSVLSGDSMDQRFSCRSGQIRSSKRSDYSRDLISDYESTVRVPAWKKIKPFDVPSVLANSDEVCKSRKEENVTSELTTEVQITNEKPLSERTIHTEDDLNRLAARYLKADLVGRSELAQQLKAELDKARQQFYKQDHSSKSVQQQKSKEQILLTKMDSSGNQRPIVSAREEAGFERRVGKKQRPRKYDDETLSSRYSLKQMFEREKLTTAEDNTEMFMNVAAQCQDSDGDEETSSISKKAIRSMSHDIQEEKDIGKAMKQHQQMSDALEKCEYCLDQPKMLKYLIVTIGEQFYLSLPNYQSLTKGHCLIVPKTHVSSFLNLDEEALKELEELQHLLRRFFGDQGKSVIFLETSMHFKRCLHAYRECIPVPQETGDMAPLYFKKALLESEEEWAQNVKLVDLTKKGLHRSIPKNFPYFCVLFDPAVHGGYAHVIEDERTFPRNFGKEVLGGMIDVNYDHLYKNRREKDPLAKSTETVEFTKRWERFNSCGSK